MNPNSSIEILSKGLERSDWQDREYILERMRDVHLKLGLTKEARLYDQMRQDFLAEEEIAVTLSSIERFPVPTPSVPDDIFLQISWTRNCTSALGKPPELGIERTTEKISFGYPKPREVSRCHQSFPVCKPLKHPQRNSIKKEIALLSPNSVMNRKRTTQRSLRNVKRGGIDLGC